MPNHFGEITDAQGSGTQAACAQPRAGGQQLRLTRARPRAGRAPRPGAGERGPPVAREFPNITRKLTRISGNLLFFNKYIWNSKSQILLSFFAIFNFGRKNHCSEDPSSLIQLNKPVPFTEFGSKNLTNDF